MGKLLEDALRGRALSAAQDASDCAWLLEAPSPIVLMLVFIPPSWWRQRRKACVAVRAILARLIPPTSLTRLVLLAILARSVTPPLARATVFPSSSTSSSSSAIAPVIALGASAYTPILHGPELLAFIGVVGVEVVVHAVPAALRRFGLVSAPLGVWFCREHVSPLVLMMVFIPPRLWWQRREARVALWGSSRG